MDHGRIVRLLKLMELLCSNVDYTIQELITRLEYHAGAYYAILTH